MMARRPGRVPPHSLPAEESLLGAAMLSPSALEVAMSEVSAEDFYSPANGTIYTAIRDLWIAGHMAVDPVLIIERLRAQDLLDHIGGPAVLVSIQANTPATSNASKYARVITDHAMLRRMIATGTELAEIGYTWADAAEAWDRAKELVGQFELPVHDTDPSPSWTELAAEVIEYDWVVPGLIERSDRLLLTGAEGFGKSTLLRQMSVQIAAGIHPFRFHPIDPCRVLIVDVENGKRQIQRKLVPMTRIAREPDPDALRIEVRTEGLDLTQSADRSWLIDRVAASRPDVVVIGPIYKLHDGDPHDEAPAKRVAKFLDLIRTKYRCALLIEAHSPHGEGGRRRDLRPFGASLWRRWPEFGYGLRAAGDDEPNVALFEPWRGDRDEREWPRRLLRGAPGSWPWGDADYHPREYR